MRSAATRQAGSRNIEYRALEKRFGITRRIVGGETVAGGARMAWRERYCVDMRTRMLHGPEDYFEVLPEYRLCCGPEDVGEAVGRLNLVPSPRLVGVTKANTGGAIDD
jgi:hypothetical protein